MKQLILIILVIIGIIGSCCPPEQQNKNKIKIQKVELNSKIYTPNVYYNVYRIKLDNEDYYLIREGHGNFVVVPINKVSIENKDSFLNW